MSILYMYGAPEHHAQSFAFLIYSFYALISDLS